MQEGQAARREFFAGSLMALIGVGVAVQASSYDIGSLTEMGPGFLPLILGCVLMLCGVIIAANRHRGTEISVAEPGHTMVPPLDWRGGGAIILGVASFIALGDQVGLVPAIFACVFIAALGDRDTTLGGAAILAGAITVLGSALFVYALKIPFPLFRW